MPLMTPSLALLSVPLTYSGDILFVNLFSQLLCGLSIGILHYSTHLW
jgi:hypothetical protein